MQFLYPKFLWALFTLAIPIIIHLFNFRRYKTVYFSNVAFLQNIRKQTKSRSTLKNLLILLMRMLAIFFLVMVFAKPYIPVGDKTKVEEVPHVAIYIDNSFSMEAEGKYGVLLESAKVKAREITGLFPAGTKYLLTTNDFLLLHQRFVSGEQLVEWVSQIGSTHVVRSLGEVLDKISVLMPNNDTNVVHNVFVLSDFQKNTLKGMPVKLSKNLKLFAVPFISQTKSNLYIDSVWFETPGHYKGKPEKLYVKIKNVSSQSFVDIPLQLFMSDSLKSSVVFNIGAQSTKEIAVPFVNWSTGVFKAYAEITDYPITFDNRMYFNFTIREKKPVLIIGEDNSPNYLNTLYKNDDIIEPNTVGVNSIPYSAFNDYRVIFLNELADIPSGLTSEAVKYAKNGGTLVFIPSSNGNLDSYKMFLQNLGQLFIEGYIDQQGNITIDDLKNRLFKDAFNTDLTDAQMPEYKGFYPITIGQKANANVICKAESGSPLFIQLPVEKGGCYLSAFGFDAKTTDFGIHPLFVPLFYNLALYSSSPSSIFYWIKPGLYSEVARKKTAGEPFGLIEELSGKELKPKHKVTQQGITVYPAISELSAGHYSVMSGGVFQDYISYNFDRKESDITYYTPDELNEVFKNSGSVGINVVDPNSNKMAKTIKQQSHGKPLSIMFLWLVIGALLFEMVLLRFLK